MKSFYINLAVLFITLTNIAQNRPQTPKAPYNYTVEDVRFTNILADSITLAGTLTLPKDIKKPPVAILISGSGPQNRDEEIANHKPFHVIAHHLTNNGIAVLRYDDRGTAESEGNFKTATSFDFATDTEAAINYLKSRNDINTKKIGLIGHSEGGLISWIIASRNKDVAYVISLAGTGVVGSEVMESQSWEIAKQMGATEETLKFNKKLTSCAYNAIKSETHTDSIKSRIEASIKQYKVEIKDSPYAFYLNDALINQLKSIADNKWLSTFIKTNPQDYISKVKCPVLALNGSKDLQVLPKLNLNSIEAHLQKAKNKDIIVKELENLNHLFQKTESGNPNEYEKLEETFSEVVLELMTNWIKKRF